MSNLIDFNVYLITDRHQVRAGQTLFSVVEEALKGGIKAVQLREKDLSDAELYPLALEMRELTTRYRARLFINHNIKIAVKVNADGVHLGRGAIPTTEARQLIGPSKLIGVSTHSKNEIKEATEQGADFVTFGPVYATPSKLRYGPPQGLQTLATACLESKLPVFALGGIKSDNFQKTLTSGAKGIALISAIIASPSPKDAAQAFST